MNFDFLFFFWREYKEEKRQREIDEMLPAALFQIASFPQGTPTERIFESIAEGDFGSLSREFSFALKQIRAGYSVREALGEMKKRNPSVLLRRACDLLLKAYRSGGDAGGMFKEIAEDIYSLHEIVRESAAALSLQKYTLLIGGAVLVPIVLGLLFNITSSLQQGFSEELLSMPSNPQLFQAVLWANQLYLVVFALVAGVFISRLEGKPGKAIVYFAAMAPLALILFNLVRGAIII